MIGKTLLNNNWEESEQSEALGNKCQQRRNLVAVQPQENVYPHLRLPQLFFAVK